MCRSAAERRQYSAVISATSDPLGVFDQRFCREEKRVSFRILAVAATLLLAGCISSGTRVSEDQLQQLVRGKTTETDVIARLGPPDYSERSADGERSDMYMYSKFAPKAQSFIPLVGAFIAGTNSQSKTVRFVFSRNGVLRDWSVIEMNSASENGFLNQK